MLGWLLAALLFTVAVWTVAIPLGFGVYLSHLPARRSLDDANLGAAKQSVTIPVTDSLELSGWYVRPRNGATVIALHGTGSNRLGVERHSRLLVRHGYGVLALDLRGHGESDGRSTSAPWTMDEDVSAVLTWLRARDEVDPQRIGLVGVSMGGEVAVRVAASERAIRATVAEGLNGGAADARDAGHSWLSLVQLGMLSAVSALLIGEGTGSDAELVEQIAPRPVLLISAGEGPEATTNRYLLQRAGRSAQLWNLPDAPHAAAIRTEPREYERRVIGFLDRALGD